MAGKAETIPDSNTPTPKYKLGQWNRNPFFSANPGASQKPETPPVNDPKITDLGEWKTMKASPGVLPSEEKALPLSEKRLHEQREFQRGMISKIVADTLGPKNDQTRPEKIDTLAQVVGVGRDEISGLFENPITGEVLKTEIMKLFDEKQSPPNSSPLIH